MQNFFGFLSKAWLFLLSSLIILSLAVLITLYLVAYFADDTVVRVTGNANIDFRVFYIENILYEENPIPNNLHFYISFTDFIEIDSGFVLQISDEADVYYRYTATERLIIRYISSVDGTENPIMFEETRFLSEASGSASGYKINLPGGTYTINPQRQIYRYHEITAETFRQLDEHLGFRGLSADLFIDFTYVIQIPSLGISRTITGGYRLPLGMEVYTLSLTGTQNFSDYVNIEESLFEPTMLVVIASVAALIISGFCLFVGIKKIQTDPNIYRNEAKFIIKKYDNEIITSSIPLPLSAYTHIPVGDFRELLKLAINQGEHIMCYHNSDLAEFAVIIKEHAYYYLIKYKTD